MLHIMLLSVMVALSQTDNAKKYYEYIVNDFKTSGYYREADEYVSSH